MRPFVIILGFAILTFGVVMFLRIGDSERLFNAKLQSIHDGKVQPETLTVVRKYINPGRHGSEFEHVIFRSNRDPKVNCPTTREFYDSVNTNSTVTGYYFPDGYFIPQSQGHDAGVAKWVFLGFGGIAGAGFLLVGLTSGKTRTTDEKSRTSGVGLQDLMTAIRNRNKRE